MTIHMNYSDLTMSLPQRFGIPIPVAWPLMAEAVVQDASGDELSVLFAMMTRRMRVIAEGPNGPRGTVAPNVLELAGFTAKGCKTDQTPATSTGETGELPAALVGSIECLPIEPEPVNDDDGPVILPMSLTRDENINSKT